MEDQDDFSPHDAQAIRDQIDDEIVDRAAAGAPDARRRTGPQTGQTATSDQTTHSPFVKSAELI
jgi:hypothetical protein